MKNVNYSSIEKKIKSEFNKLNASLKEISTNWEGVGPVYGQGNFMAEIFILTKAPFLTSSKKTELLSPQAQTALHSSFEKLKINQDLIYLSSLLKFYFPNKKSLPLEIRSKLKQLLKLEIAIIEPKIILGLGQAVTTWLKEIAGQDYYFQPRPEGYFIWKGQTFYLEAPSFDEALKNSEQKKRLWSILLLLTKIFFQEVER